MDDIFKDPNQITYTKTGPSKSGGEIHSKGLGYLCTLVHANAEVGCWVEVS